MQHSKILLPFLLLLTACSGTKYLSSKKVSAAEITSLELFRPVTSLVWVQQKNDAVLSDSLSSRAESLIRESLLHLKVKIPAIGPVTVTDTAMQYTIEKETITACRASSAYQSINVLPLPPSVDKILEQKGKRFGLLVYYSGYKRSLENYYWARRKAALNNALNMLTIPGPGGWPVSIVPTTHIYKSNMALYVMIVDSFDNKIIFFNESWLTDKDPADPAVIANELNKMLAGYFK